MPLLAVCVLLPCGGSIARSAGAEEPIRPQISLLDLDSAGAIEAARTALKSGTLEQAVRHLQSLHEHLWGKSHVIPMPSASARRAAGGFPGPTSEAPNTPSETVFVGATPHLVRVLRSLDPEAVSAYRAKYDLAAAALYAEALRARDPHALERMSLFYPAATPSVDAALTAAEIFLSRMQLDRARATLDSLVWESVPEAPAQERLADAWLLLSVLDRDPALYDSWIASRVYAPERQPLPKPPTRGAAGESTLPTLPFTKKSGGMFHWATIPYDAEFKLETSRTAPRLYIDPVNDWVALTTQRKLLRFDLEGGVALSELALPAPVKLHHKDLFNLELYPTDGSGEVLLASYIRETRAREDFHDVDIKVSIPKRSLVAARIQRRGVTPRREDALLWDSARSASPLIRELSFNSPPLISGSRIYALGWRDSGYVTAYVVALDLHTGDEIWSTILVGNQVELTMFGYLMREPFLGALAERDGVLYACTNLGAMAALGAEDGGVHWISEYDAIVPETSSFRLPAVPRIKWDHNPLIVLERSIVATPLDSHDCLEFDRFDGRLLGVTIITDADRADRDQYGRDRVFLLGIHGDHLVFVDGDMILLVPADDVDGRPGYRRLSVDPPVEARPALVAGGIVYSTAQGLFHRDFHRDGASQEIADPPPTVRRPRSATSKGIDWDVKGAVRVVEDRILVYSSVRTICYKAIPRPPAPPSAPPSAPRAPPAESPRGPPRGPPSGPPNDSPGEPGAPPKEQRS